MNQPVFLNSGVVRTDAMLEMFRKVLRRMLITTVIGAVLALGVGYLVGGMSGVWAALLATGIGLFFTGTTVGLMYLVVGRGPELLQLVLLGGWIIKMAIVLVLMLWLRGLDFYHRGMFVGALAVIALALVAVELVTVVTTRLPIYDAADPQRHAESEPQTNSPTTAPVEAGTDSPEPGVENLTPDAPDNGNGGDEDRVG